MSTTPQIAPDAVTALQGALAAEHAALWAFSYILAFVPADQATQAQQDIAAHRTLRSQIQQTLTDVGARPVSAEPAYATPFPVVDALSAGRLAVTAETDALFAWRSVLEHTTDAQLRSAALKAMATGSVRVTRWRAATGAVPVVPPMPGIVR